MAKPHSMVSLELDDESKLDAIMPMPMPDRPDYPFGTQICLTDREIRKMGIDPDDFVKGGLVQIHATARVTSTSKREENDEGPKHRVEFQFEDMCIDCDGEDE